MKATWGDGDGGAWVGAGDGGWNPPLFHVDGTGAATSVAIDGWPVATEAGSLWGRAATDIWAAGGSSLAHWDGAAWTPVAAPAGIDTLGGTRVTGDAGSVWLIGRGPRFFRLAR